MERKNRINQGQIVASMMKIRREQMNEFSGYMRESFTRRMMEHLRGEFPDRTSGLDDTPLRTIIEKGISNASRYEISRECDVERFLDLMFILSFDFDTNRASAWAGGVLRLYALSPEERLDLIFDRIWGEKGEE